jgi:hypothetical protein
MSRNKIGRASEPTKDKEKPTLEGGRLCRCEGTVGFAAARGRAASPTQEGGRPCRPGEEAALFHTARKATYKDQRGLGEGGVLIILRLDSDGLVSV